MKAIVYYAPNDIRYEERPAPTPQNDNMLAEVICCAICGSDLKMWKSGNPRCKPPRIIGHEVAAVLVHVGEKVRGFSVGERVTLATTVGCGECVLCKKNLSNLCPNAQPISNATDGAFAKLLEIPPLAIQNGNCIKIPDNLPDAWAALSEPLSCAVNAQSAAVLPPKASVLIIGGGPLGALHAELAKARGAAKVMITEMSSKRLDLLRELKDVVLIDASTEDVGKAVLLETGQVGADLVIICAPSKEAHEQALAYACKGGYVCLFASLPMDRAEVQLNSRTLHYNELKVYGVSDSRPEHVTEALRLLSKGKIDAETIITHKLPLQAFHEGLRLMADGESLKVLLYPAEGR